MPKTSKASAPKVEETPAFAEHTGELADYSVNFVSLRQDVDLTPLLRGLPNDQCQCPHWGYQFAGTQTVVYADHEETIEAGEAFYMLPGHTARASNGAEFVVFSPTAELRITEDAMARNMQALQST